MVQPQTGTKHNVTYKKKIQNKGYNNNCIVIIINTIINNNNRGTVSMLLYFPKYCRLLLTLLMQVILSTVIDLLYP